MRSYSLKYFIDNLALVCLFTISLLSSSCSNEPTRSYSSIIDSLVQQYYVPGQSEKTVSYLQNNIPAFAELAKDDAAKKFNILADYYTVMDKNLYMAYKYSDSAVKAIANKAESNKDLYLEINLRHSNILFDLNRNEEGYESFFQTKRTIEQNFDSCYLWRFYDKISHGLYANRKYLPAINYYLRSVDLIRNCKIYSEIDIMYYLQGNYDNIALCYEKIGRFELADSFYTEALAVTEKFRYKHSITSDSDQVKLDIAESVILGNFGSSLLQQKKFVPAIDCLTKSLQLSRDKFGVEIDRQFNLIKLADAYLGCRKIEQTDSVLKVLKAHMQKGTEYDVEIRLKNFKWQYYGYLKKYEEAFKVKQEYQVYKDSFNNALLLLANKIDFETELNTIGNRITLVELNKKNDQFTIWMLFLAAMLVMTLFVVLLIRKNQLLLKESYARQKDLNAQILQQNRHLESNLAVLEQSQNDNNKAIKILSHDLRTPLSGMYGLMGLLKSEDNLTGNQLKLISLAQQTSKDALSLIENLLKSYTSLGNDIKIAIVISELITYCAEMLQPRALEKKIKIINNVESVTLFINRERIWRVFANLLTNAIKFSAVGGTITINSQTTDTHIVISVHDTGIGIPPNMIETLFSNGLQHNRTGTAGEVS
ncbi:MAG: hypothetical protein EAZ47_11820, partial [Bacteroidetes bacterium]